MCTEYVVHSLTGRWSERRRKKEKEIDFKDIYIKKGQLIRSDWSSDQICNCSIDKQFVF